MAGVLLLWTKIFVSGAAAITWGTGKTLQGV